MKWFNFAITVLAAALVNAGSVMELITISQFQIRPNLMIAALAFFTYTSSRRDAIIAGFLVGFMADISGSTMGPSMVAYGIVGSGFSAMRDILLMDRKRNRMAVIFVMSVCVMILVDILTGMKTGQHIAKPLITIPFRSLYTAVIGALLWYVFDFTAMLLGVKKKHSRRDF